MTISSIDLTHPPMMNDFIKFDCYKAGHTWHQCLLTLEDNEWKPTLKNGNVKISHFYTVLELFKAAEVRGDEFISSQDLLEWIGIEKKSKIVLETLVKHLPILMAQKGKTVILINIATFLQSKSLVSDLMQLVEFENNDCAASTSSSAGEFKLPEPIRKQGSGRPRIVDTRPDILEATRIFSESAGISAHNRRRSDIGHFGFTIKQLQDFIKKNLLPR